MKTGRWVKDFEQVREAIATHYADFDEALEREGLNPVAMSNVTLRNIRAAETDEEVRRAIDVFVASFGDPRLRLQDQARQALNLADDEALLADASATRVCRALRYRDYDPEPYGLGILNDYTFSVLISLNNLFGAGIIDAGPRGVGYVRIPSFRTQDYYSACTRAWTDRQAQTEEPCDADCLKDITDRVIPNMLIDDFARRIEGFAERRVSTIIVDLTGTEGTGDWASAIGVLLAGSDVSCPSVAVRRTSDWRRRFNDMRRTLGRYDTQSDAEETLISVSRDQLKRLADETRDTCRRPQSIWTNPEFDLSTCQSLTQEAFSACGLYGQAPGVGVSGSDANAILYKPDYFAIADSPQPSRIIVVTDNETDGAAELLTVMLQESGKANVVGKTTAGSGCLAAEGDDSRVILRRSQLELLVPNCRVLRSDGTNAAAGITPDLPLDWAGDANSDATRDIIYEAILPD